MLNRLSNERGIATLEVILMIVVLGILSAMAVPRFTNVTTSANTARVQADLATIDNAIAIYQMEKGTDPTNLSDLNDYIQDVDNLKPPKGNIFINGKSESMPATTYSISKNRAQIGSYTSGSITKVSSSTSTEP